MLGVVVEAERRPAVDAGLDCEQTSGVLGVLAAAEVGDLSLLCIVPDIDALPAVEAGQPPILTAAAAVGAHSPAVDLEVVPLPFSAPPVHVLAAGAAKMYFLFIRMKSYIPGTQYTIGNVLRCPVLGLNISRETKSLELTYHWPNCACSLQRRNLLFKIHICV